MKKLVEYLYYKIYSWKKKDVPEWTASFGISLLMFLKLVILYEITTIIDKKLLITGIPKFIIVVIMLTLIIINYFWFIHKKKYLKIISKYNKETEKQKLIRGFLILLYFFLTIGIILLLAYIGKHVRIID